MGTAYTNRRTCDTPSSFPTPPYLPSESFWLLAQLDYLPQPFRVHGAFECRFIEVTAHPPRLSNSHRSASVSPVNRSIHDSITSTA